MPKWKILRACLSQGSPSPESLPVLSPAYVSGPADQKPRGSSQDLPLPLGCLPRLQHQLPIIRLERSPGLPLDFCLGGPKDPIL